MSFAMASIDMTRRYFVPDLPPNGGPISLPDAEAQHAIRVMRVQVGQSMTLFDGSGNEAVARVTGVTKRQCQCEAEIAAAINRESIHKLHLAVALPKPDRARELIERLTELGVSSLTPLVAERSQRPPSEALVAKLDRAVVEASKQCGRNRLLQITSPSTSQDFFRQSQSKRMTRWIADPEGGKLPPMTEHPPAEVIAAVGPEGGWSDAELDSAIECGFVKLGLGKRIYRIETAATVIAALVSASE